MAYGFLDIAITPAVRSVQREMGVAHLWNDFKGHRDFDRFTEAEAQFIAQRDSFYMATVSETGWPYMQHRGGPPGFLKVVDERTLGFADYSGNRQYISTGNLTAGRRASLFLMDYRRRARMKLYAELEIVRPGEDPALVELVTDRTYKAKVERVFRVRLKSFDWNCAQHITPRFTEPELADVLQSVGARLEALEAENAELRARLVKEEQS